MQKFNQHIIKNQEIEVLDDRYHTLNLSMSEKMKFYEKKLVELRKVKNEHKLEYGNLRQLKNSSVNVLQFKLDEMTKKMRNEISRLSQEESRHEESQKNETKKLQNQIDFLKENNTILTKVLQDFLQRVKNLERSVGPLSK